jgi:phosphoenolpyruvate---glycerone phosphotransferase subunit DhaM
LIGVVLVSHSAKLAEGIAELVAHMQPELAVRAAGGTIDGRLGTSPDKIHQAIIEVDNPDGVLLLLDLGSAVMSAEIALEWLSDEQRARVLISDAPLVEGAVLVATSAALGLSLEELATSAQEARHFPKDLGPVSSGRG